MNAIIYKITNTKNNKIYIGQTKQPLNRRFKDHIRHAFNSDRPNDLNCKLYIAMREEGINHFIIEELETLTDTTLHAIDKKEIEWIARLDTTNPDKGYNVDNGGHVISEKCRKARIDQMIGAKLEGRALEIVRENGMKIAKSVCQYDKQMNLIAEYPSIIEASRKSGCDRRTIQRQLKGESGKNTARSISNMKYIWMYKTEQSNII
jgi:AraC-like DNA-binding protein